MCKTKIVTIGAYEREVRYQSVSSCPMCHFDIEPLELLVVEPSCKQPELTIVYQCARCAHLFIATYRLKDLGGMSHTHQATLNTLVPSVFKRKEFDSRLSELSESFVRIFNQAAEAEAAGLDELSGVGYRKALEYLIKDYLIYKEPDNADSIRHMKLGNCISNKVTNEKLQAVASRAAWLGNDYAHYDHRFGEYDILDLKKFIDAAVYWILAELTTEDALNISRRV